MNQEIVPYHIQDSREERMLFVRTEGIIPTMVKAPIILASIIIMAIVMPSQHSFSSTRSLDLIIYSDGSTHISSEIEVDPLQPDFGLNLYGSSIDNFVAVGENGFLLSSEIINDTALVDTFGSSVISVDYDIHDLVSKEGRVWTFTLDAPTDYTLLMPENSVIVGMSSLPLSMEIVDEQTKLSLSSGSSEINYVFGTPSITPPPAMPDSDFDYSVILIGGVIAAVGIVSAIFLRRSQKPSKQTELSKPITEHGKPLDPETIFKLRSDLREDDKELVNFIFNNGGQALESELRKRFLQPRTTMWRAVKRLERHGIVEIEKKDLQNLVKLKNELEDEQ